MFRAVFWVVLPCKMSRQSFYTAVQPRRQLWTTYSLSLCSASVTVTLTYTYTMNYLNPRSVTQFCMHLSFTSLRATCSVNLFLLIFITLSIGENIKVTRFPVSGTVSCPTYCLQTYLGPYIVFSSYLRLNLAFQNYTKEVKVKQSLYTPWRRLGGEEL
jgi:ABC-type arginine transport system permease subunit